MAVIEQEQARTPGLVNRLATRLAGGQVRRRMVVLERNARWVDEVRKAPTVRERLAMLQEEQSR